jgi:hypothetical protein
VHHPDTSRQVASPSTSPKSARAPSRFKRALSGLGHRLLDVRAALAIGALCSIGLGVGLAEAVPTDADVLPLSEVKPGMKGYGLTVLSGTEPERFDVEIISTLKNFRPNQDLILIKTIHPRLNITRTVAGMSGSPIYLNDKMIGAYAYGWMFGAEAIAGVTPIHSMIEELNRPLPKSIAPRGGSLMPSAGVGGVGGVGVGGSKPAKGARSFMGAAGDYDLALHAKQIAAKSAPALAAPEGLGLMRASTPVMLGGLGGVALKLANDLLTPMGLDPLQGGGGSSSKKPDPSAPTKFVDGGAIGVELVRGDIAAMGIGTVTRVTGNKLLAFGHPMLGGGVESLPTAIGRVHWILASTNRSFKIGEAARSLGALVNDRQAAIVVDASVKAPTFPMKLLIEGVAGAPKPLWNVEVSHDQFMAPIFAAMAIGNAAEQTTSERQDMTWRATSKLKLARYGAISMTEFGAGSGSPIGPDDFVRGRLVRSLGALLNNPWEPVTIEGVETEMRVTYEREVSLLRGTKVLDPEIDAGEKVRVRLDLQPYQGKVESKIIEVAIPEELAGREVEIEIAPGYEVERPQPTPNNVGELVAMLQNQTFDPESVVVSFRLKENGAVFGGKMASRLPPGAIDTLRIASESEAPETFVAQVQTAIPLKRFMLGRDTARVKVRPILR